MKVKEEAKLPKLTRCTRCGYVSSQEICKACVLLEGLNRGLPRLGIGKTSKIKKYLAENSTNSHSVDEASCSTTTTTSCNITENQEEEEDKPSCDNTQDRKCLCRGALKASPKNNELSITKQLIRELEL